MIHNKNPHHYVTTCAKSTLTLLPLFLLVPLLVFFHL
jgi:hypothetical protein